MDELVAAERDGNMRRAEWIVGPHGPLKTDYEHHGLGKEELNVIDPAYDLADTILNLELSPEEAEAVRVAISAPPAAGASAEQPA